MGTKFIYEQENDLLNRLKELTDEMLQSYIQLFVIKARIVKFEQYLRDGK